MFIKSCRFYAPRARNLLETTVHDTTMYKSIHIVGERVYFYWKHARLGEVGWCGSKPEGKMYSQFLESKYCGTIDTAVIEL